jgi:arylsulfatase
VILLQVGPQPLAAPLAQVPLQQIAGRFLMSMKEYPPSQTPGSFNLDKIQKQIEAAAAGR